MLFDIIVIVVASANVLWLPVNRKLPAVLFLAALAGLLLATNLLPDSGLRVAGKGLAIVSYVVVLLAFPHRLAGLSRVEADFDTRLRSILKPVLQAQNAWARSQRSHRGNEVATAQAAAKRAGEAALRELGGVAPPSPEWARTVELLRTYLVVANDRAASRGSADGSGSAVPSDEEIQSMIGQLDSAWDRALHIRRLRP